MSKLWLFGIVSLSALLWVDPAKAALIGPDVIARVNPTDLSGNVAWFAALDAWKAPEAGSITGFQYYKSQAQEVGSDGNLRFLALRLTSGDAISPSVSNFQVLYISDPINTTGLAPGAHSVSTGSPVALQAGDLIGLMGRGVSFDIQVTSPIVRIVYSSAENNPTLGAGAATSAIVVPTVGSTFQVKPSANGAWVANDYNWYTSNGGRRVYSMAADFTPVPEPSSIALLVMAGLGIMVVRRSARHRRHSAEM